MSPVDVLNVATAKGHDQTGNQLSFRRREQQVYVTNHQHVAV